MWASLEGGWYFFMNFERMCSQVVMASWGWVSSQVAARPERENGKKMELNGLNRNIRKIECFVDTNKTRQMCRCILFFETVKLSRIWNNGHDVRRNLPSVGICNDRKSNGGMNSIVAFSSTLMYSPSLVSHSGKGWKWDRWYGRMGFKHWSGWSWWIKRRRWTRLNDFLADDRSKIGESFMKISLGIRRSGELWRSLRSGVWHTLKVQTTLEKN